MISIRLRRLYRRLSYLTGTLRCFRPGMQARLAGVIRGADTIDHFRNAGTFHNTPRRPIWGDFDRMLGEAAPPTQAEEDASIMESLRDEMKLRRVTE